MFASVIEGDFLCPKSNQQLNQADLRLKAALNENQCKGFTNILMQKNVGNGIASLIQTSGLGGLKHNSVLISWPEDWRLTERNKAMNLPVFYQEFLHSLRTANAAGLACIVPKLEADWPIEKKLMNRTIDIWWIIHDGGLIILLGWLLKQNSVWKNCRLRLFAVAEENDNSIKMVNNFFFHLSIFKI